MRALALAAIVALTAAPALAQPSDRFNYDPNKVSDARRIASDEQVMWDCIRAVVPGMMTLRSRSKIIARVAQGCTTGGDGVMTKEQAAAFLVPAINREIDYLLSTTQ